MFRFGVSVKGLKSLEDAVTMLGKLQNVPIFWGMIDQALQELTDARFANRGFGKWPEYEQTMGVERAIRYRDWKNSEYPGTGDLLLQLSGDLRDSLGITNMTKRNMTWGTKGVKYADAHNFGNERNAKRRFLPTQQELFMVGRKVGLQFSLMEANKIK